MRSAIANANEAAEKANISIDPDDLWVRTAFVDRGPTKNRRRVRPAPQGRAYREQRHFCHVTISLSNDERPAKNGKQAEAAEAKPAKLAENKRRKRGGAAAAPRAKRATPKTDETASEKPAAKKASKKKAKTEEVASEE
jgi:ribosomal L22p/L17e-like protein